MPQRKKNPAARARRNKAATAATLHESVPEDRSGWTAKELRAEIDRRNKGRPADERLSKGGGLTGMADALLEDDYQIPPLPERPQGWHDLTSVWWREVWTSPMQAEWHPETDYFNVFRAAMHFDDMVRAVTPAERQKADSSFIKAIDPHLGLTPYGRRRMEWQFEMVDEAKERGKRRRGQNSGQPAPAPPPSGAADPRAQLHAVK